jgi:hypothetical protein
MREGPEVFTSRKWAYPWLSLLVLVVLLPTPPTGPHARWEGSACNGVAARYPSQLATQDEPGQRTAAGGVLARVLQFRRVNHWHCLCSGWRSEGRVLGVHVKGGEAESRPATYAVILDSGEQGRPRDQPFNPVPVDGGLP